MPSAETLVLFTAAAVLMNLSPGPSNLYVVAQTVARGRTAGAVAVLGLAAGSLVHVAGAAIGVTAVLAYFESAYAVLKLLGAGYLI